MLQRISKLRPIVAAFLCEENKLPDDCISLNGHTLNTSNTHLQGKGMLLSHLVNSLDAFTMQLTLFAKQLENGNLDHFVNLKERETCMNQNRAGRKAATEERQTELIDSEEEHKHA